MKSTKTFNNFSAEFLNKIPKLKPGEVKTFRMLNGQPNPDPDPREVAKEPMIYGKVQLQTNMRVYDEFQKNENGEVVGGYVDAGAVERWANGQPERFFLIVPGMDMGSRFQGKFSLTGGNQRDEELWEILYISPQRKDSPCADNSITPLFELLDVKRDSQAKVSSFDKLKKAIDVADKITVQKAREVMAGLNQPTYQDEDILLATVKDLAKSRPEDFLKTYNDPETETIGVVRQAIDADVISHDPSSGVVKLGTVQLTTLKIDPTDSFSQAFTKWVGSVPNGKEVLANIKKQLEKKQAKV